QRINRNLVGITVNVKKAKGIACQATYGMELPTRFGAYPAKLVHPRFVVPKEKEGRGPGSAGEFPLFLSRNLIPQSLLRAQPGTECVRIGTSEKAYRVYLAHRVLRAVPDTFRTWLKFFHFIVPFQAGAGPLRLSLVVRGFDEVPKLA